MSLHVNYEIRWKNFRAFEDTGWVTIKPLTILLGPNNSGKTSVVGPLLLMNQTLSSWDGVAPLVTRGPLIDSGIFKDIVHKHDLRKDIFLGLRYHKHDSAEKLRKVGNYPPGAVEFTLTAGKAPEDMVLRRFELLDLHMRPLFSQTRTSTGRFEFESQALNRLSSKELEAIRGNRPVNFLLSPTRTLSGLKPRGPNSIDETSIPHDYSKSFMMYISALGIVAEELTDLFRNSSYIGPLRERPRRFYEVEGEMPVSVGVRGEHMANVVRREFPQLHSKLDQWVRRFEFGSKLTLRDISEQFFSLSFERGRPATKTNIADAGFGASQVLPLIVQALTARNGSLTIAEQPEIHLNPRLQYVLADLFAEMANNDRRVIIETHSEHLLLRLRSLIADGSIDCSKVALYFVEMNDGVSTIRNISIQSDGRIPHDAWPQGFFEDSLRESLALATAQSKRRNPKGRKTAVKTGDGC